MVSSDPGTKPRRFSDCSPSTAVLVVTVAPTPVRWLLDALVVISPAQVGSAGSAASTDARVAHTTGRSAW